MKDLNVRNALSGAVGLVSAAVLLAATVAVPAEAEAQQTTPPRAPALEWDPNDEPDLAGYVVRWRCGTHPPRLRCDALR